MPAAADLLEDGDRSKEDHKRQDAEELEIATEIRKDARTWGAARRARRVLAEAGSIDAGVRVAAGRDQGWQRPPAGAVVVLDLLKGTRWEAQRQVIGRDDRHGPSAGLAHAADTVDVPADLDARRRRGWVRVGRDAAPHACRAGWSLERARTEIDHGLVVTGLHAATGDLAVLYRQGRLAGERRLVPRRKVGWRRLPPIGLGRHDDAVVDRRAAHAAMEQGCGDQSEGKCGNPGAPGGHAQNQAPH